MARKSRRNQPEAAAVMTVAPVFDTWVYARLSLDSGRAEDSIENQIDICKDYIGGRADLDLRGVYSDTGFTGRNFDRPDFETLLDAIRSGAVKCLVVKDLSRVGRTYIEVGELLFDTLPAHGVRFISVNDQYDSFADDAARKKLLVLFKNLVNHMYSQDLSQKLKSSFVVKQRKGELLGSQPPYGYMFTPDGKHLKILPEAAVVVRLIFDMRLQGNSTIKIMDYLNKNGLPTPNHHYYQLGILTHEKHAKKCVWGNSYIVTLLTNEVYTGCQVQGKYDRQGKKFIIRPKSEWIIHHGTHEAIIDTERFEAVQTLMDAAREKYKKHGNTLDENVFAGKVFCSRCGKAVKRAYHRRSKSADKPGFTDVTYGYYCRPCCTELKDALGLKEAKHLGLTVLETAVSETLRRQIQACLDMDALLKRSNNAPSVEKRRGGLAAERDKALAAAKKADDLLTAAYKHHLGGLLDAREFSLARERFEQTKLEAETRAARIGAEIARYDLETARHSECITSFCGLNGFDKLTKDILHALVDRIMVTPITNEITMTLNYTDGFTGLRQTLYESGVLTDVR